MLIQKLYGFNFQWMFSWNPDRRPEPADERALDFLAKFGFNFVRIPADYRFWTEGFDYFRPNESIFDYFDEYLEACRSRGIHLYLNLHRAPGYCINRNNLEKHNLWIDEPAQDAFQLQDRPPDQRRAAFMKLEAVRRVDDHRDSRPPRGEPAQQRPAGVGLNDEPGEHQHQNDARRERPDR